MSPSFLGKIRYYILGPCPLYGQRLIGRYGSLDGCILRILLIYYIVSNASYLEALVQVRIQANSQAEH